MTRLDRIKGLNTQIVELDHQIEQVAAELLVLRHIDDDAQRDAAVSERYDDHADARMTRRDVARMTEQVSGLERDRTKLIRKRDRLIAKLASR